MSLNSLFALPSRTYYLSSTGNDGNDGLSIATAWASLGQATNYFYSNPPRPGDRLLLQGGVTFGGQFYLGACRATSSNPFVVGSYGTGMATIYNASSSGIFIYDCAGIVVENLYVVGAGSTTNINSYHGINVYNDTGSALNYLVFRNLGIYSFGYSGITIYGSGSSSSINNVLVENCIFAYNGDAGFLVFADTSVYGLHKNFTVRNCLAFGNTGKAGATTPTGSGVCLGGVSGGLIELCEAYNNTTLANSSNGNGFGIWCYNSQDVIIQYNVSHENYSAINIDGGGIDIDINCKRCYAQYNYTYNNGGAGLMIYGSAASSSADTNVVRYNISLYDGYQGTPTGGLLGAFGLGSNIGYAQVYNNTVIAGNTCVFALFDTVTSSTNLTVFNNIFASTSSTGTLVKTPNSGSAVSNNILSNNAYWNFASGTFKAIASSVTYTSFSSFQTGANQESTNSLASPFGDPLFKNLQMYLAHLWQDLKYHKDLELLPNSPLIGKGIAPANPGSYDIYGLPNNQASSYDVGASKYLN